MDPRANMKASSLKALGRNPEPTSEGRGVTHSRNTSINSLIPFLHILYGQVPKLPFLWFCRCNSKSSLSQTEGQQPGVLPTALSRSLLQQGGQAANCRGTGPWAQTGDAEQSSSPRQRPHGPEHSRTGLSHPSCFSDCAFKTGPDQFDDWNVENTWTQERRWQRTGS